MNMLTALILLLAAAAGLVWCRRTARLTRQQKTMLTILLGAAVVLFLGYCLLTVVLVCGID